MQAIILAGGLGSRLKSVVVNTPKVLSPVAGHPFLYYIIEYLKKQGINHFVFSLGYLANQVVSFLSENYPNISYQICIEDEPLGTGGGIKNAIKLVSSDDVFVVNADTFFEVPLKEMLLAHISSNSDCTISLKPMTNFERYGRVEIDSMNTIVSFKEKKFSSEGLINGGYIILNKKIFLKISERLPNIFSFEQDFLEKNIHSISIKGFISEGYFIDIGIPEDFKKAQIDFG